MVEYRLIEKLNEVCLVVGVYIGIPGKPDTVRVDFGDNVPLDERKKAFDILGSFDWSDAAQALWDLGRASLSAVSLVASSYESTFTADRVILRYLCTEINDVREKVGLPRKLEPEIVAGLVAAAQKGAGMTANLDR